MFDAEGPSQKLGPTPFSYPIHDLLMRLGFVETFLVNMSSKFPIPVQSRLSARIDLKFSNKIVAIHRHVAIVG